MQDLKRAVIRGGAARLAGQAATFALRIVSLGLLARLLDPKDFGLVGMVTAITGVLTMFRDFGLSSAAVQRSSITHDQISTLFWINIAVGAALTVLVVAAAPAIAAFYGDPQLRPVADVLALGFLFNAAGVQHSALLQREMRFTTITLISVIALAFSSALGIGGAIAGLRYWGLVAMSVASPAIATAGFWIASRWLPGPPRRGADIRSALQFGGGLTLSGILVYLGYNVEKVLIGRFWGADAIGIYGRAYQLVSIPTDNLNSAIGEVVFSALSRIRDNPAQLRTSFIKGFSLILGLTLPVSVACAAFSDDIVSVVLGPGWHDAAPIVRLLAPAVTVVSIINPLGWLIFALGYVARSMKAAPVLATIMISGYVVGLPYGPKGVACAYSVALALWMTPHILWCIHGTPISFGDILRAVRAPAACSVVAGAAAFGWRAVWGYHLPPVPRLVLETSLLFSIFYAVLLFVAGQRVLYSDIVRSLLSRGGAVAQSARPVA